MLEAGKTLSRYFSATPIVCVCVYVCPSTLAFCCRQNINQKWENKSWFGREDECLSEGTVCGRERKRVGITGWSPLRVTKDQKDMIYFSKSEFSIIKGDKRMSQRTGLLFNNPRPKLRSEGKMNHLELIKLKQERDAKILRQIFLSVLVSDDLALQPHSSEKPRRSSKPLGRDSTRAELRVSCQDCSDRSISKVLSISHFSSARGIKRHSTQTEWLRWSMSQDNLIEK